MISNSFERIHQARTPGTYFALGMAMASVYLIWHFSLPLVVEIAVAVFLAIVLRRLTVNPKSGFRMTETGIEFFRNRQRQTVPLAELDRASVVKQADGTTRCWLTLRDGATLALPGTDDVDARQLARELRLRGICVST